MELKVGTVLDGKVKTITGYGAFILLPENRTGMVHISEVSDAYVSDIRKHLTEGQTVRVKVIGIDENGKIGLSVKRALPQRKPQETNAPKERAPLTFEEKLKQFMSESDSKLSASGQYEHITKSRKR